MISASITAFEATVIVGAGDLAVHFAGPLCSDHVFHSNGIHSLET